jgi:hypothetical protein
MGNSWQRAAKKTPAEAVPLSDAGTGRAAIEHDATHRAYLDDM